MPLLDSYTFGDDSTDALYMAHELVETMVSSLVEDGEEVTGRRPSPDGGFVAVLFANGVVLEEPDMCVQDVADMLGVTTGHVYTLCQNGQLDSHQVGSTVLVSAKSVRECLDAEVASGGPERLLGTA